MRVGFLFFGDVSAETAGLPDALRARDIDVVTAPEEPTSVREEAMRLHRADCDGVVFAVGDEAWADDAAEAALHVGCPILLSVEMRQRNEVGKILVAIVPVLDVMSRAETTPERVGAWLDENNRKARQCGAEAALKLYGARLFSVAPDLADFDMKVRWLRQFGILIRNESAPDEPRPDDLFAANAGDALRALTERLLSLVSGEPDPEPDHETLALIGQIADGSFSCELFRRTGQSEPPPGTSGYLTAPGDRVGAMRAACSALDIAAKIYIRLVSQ